LINKLGQQIFETGSFCVVDVLDDVCEPFLRINVVTFAGGKKAIEHGDILSSIPVSRDRLCDPANK
jgi:hypothetical protein